VANPLTLANLNQGTLNNVGDSSDRGTTGDPRRTTNLRSLRRTTQDAYAPNALGHRNSYNGIVVASYDSTAPGPTNIGARMEQYTDNLTANDHLNRYRAAGAAHEQEGAQEAATEAAGDFVSMTQKEMSLRYIYKVFIPELDPRPVPGFGNIKDPVTLSLPEVQADIPGGMGAIANGTLVVVTYENAENLYNPRITRILKEGIQIQDEPFSKRVGGGSGGGGLAAGSGNYGSPSGNSAGMPVGGETLITYDPNNYDPEQEVRDYKGRLVPVTEAECLTRDKEHHIGKKWGLLSQKGSVKVAKFPGDEYLPAMRNVHQDLINRLRQAAKNIRKNGGQYANFKFKPFGDSGRTFAGQRKAYLVKGVPGPATKVIRPGKFDSRGRQLYSCPGPGCKWGRKKKSKHWRYDPATWGTGKEKALKGEGTYSTKKDYHGRALFPGESSVAHPCNGFHTEGQAVDLNQGQIKADVLAHGPIYQGLYDAGMRRLFREFWHWGVGPTNPGKTGPPKTTLKAPYLNKEIRNHHRDHVFAATGVSPGDTFRSTDKARARYDREMAWT